MTRVKICGLTRPDDVRAAVELGADMLGFIHVPESPRFVDLPRLKTLLSLVSGKLRRVIVVRNLPPATLDKLRAELRFDDFQFHGEESAAQVHAWGGYLVLGIEGSRLDKTRLAQAGTRFLLDTSLEKRSGGTGLTFDWSILPEVPGKYLVAGGLTPENVGDLVRRYRPWGVDVSSGIETRPGHKDHAKMRRFIENVRRAAP